MSCNHFSDQRSRDSSFLDLLMSHHTSFLHHNRNYDVRREMCLLQKLENGYKCSLCETIYETVEEAVDCECSHHGGPLKVISVHYRSPKQGRHEYPDSIELMMADGTIRTYVSSS